MRCVARVTLACLLALLLGALSLSPPPTRAETQPVSEKTYDAPPHLRDTGRLLRDLFKQERYADIHAICQQGYAQATDDEARAFFLHKAADAYVAQGDPRGLDLLYQVLDRFPATMQAPAVTLDLGDIYLEHAQAAQDAKARRALALQAMDALDRFVAAYPTHERIVRALWKRGTCHELLDNLEAAISEYHTAVEAYPVSTWSHYCLLRAIELQQRENVARYDDAIADARYYIVLFPDRQPEHAQCSVAYSYWCMGNPDQAIAEYRKVLTDFPRATREAQANALYMIGDLLYEGRQLAEALAYFQWILQEYGSTSWAPEAQRMSDTVERALAREGAAR